MRRRRSATAPRTAAEVVALWQAVTTQAEALGKARRPGYVRSVLLEHGTHPAEAVRARYWLRKGWTDDGWRL